jgi:thiol-disulfide isomerase/thioredoxin
MILLWLFLSVLVPFKESKGIEYICDNNFTDILSMERNSFIFFRSETCPHCKEFHPVYEHISRKYAHKTRFYICTYNKCPKTSAFYQVSTFPTLISARYAQYFTVCESKDQERGLKDFMNSGFIEAGKYIDTVNDLVDIIDLNQSFFLSDHKFSNAEKREADQFTVNIPFYSMDGFDELKKIIPDFKPMTKLCYYRASDRQLLDVSNSVVASEIDKFLANFEKSPVMYFSVDRVNEVFVSGSLITMIKFNKNKDAVDNEEYRLLENAAKGGTKVVYFTTENSAVFDDAISPPEDAESSVIAVIKMDDENPLKWINLPDSNGKVSDPEHFIKNVAAGKVEIFIKSEQEPSDNSSPIKKYVGKNFNAEVVESSKPTVILFYKSDSYAVDKLSEKLVDAEIEFGSSLNFGMLNTAKNEVPVKVTEQMPIIGIYNKGKVSFYGKNEKLGLHDWIRRESTQYVEL